MIWTCVWCRGVGQGEAPLSSGRNHFCSEGCMHHWVKAGGARVYSGDDEEIIGSE